MSSIPILALPWRWRIDRNVIHRYHSITTNLNMSVDRGKTMRIRETSLTQKGQVTIPVEVRVMLGLKPRDKVVFEVHGDQATLRRAPSKVERWFGSVSPRQRPEDFKQLREEFEQGVAEEVIAEG